MDSALLKPANMIDSAALRRVLGPVSAAGEWERRQLATVRVLAPVSEPVSQPTRTDGPLPALEDRETVAEWLGTKVSRDEVATLSYWELRERLDH